MIDNLQRRMIDSSEEILLNQIESLCPEKWPRGETVPWIKGKKDVVALCERFKINTADIIMSYQEYFSDPRNIPALVEKTFERATSSCTSKQHGSWERILSNELGMYKVAL